MATEYNNRYALVIGASMGIGYELANLYAQDGCNLMNKYLSSRNR